MGRVIKLTSKVAILNFESGRIKGHENLGEGLTSKVYKVVAHEKSSKECAMKVIDKQRLNSQLIKNISEEIRLHRLLSRSPNILKIRRVFEDQ